jgi:MFS family permease
MDRYASEEDGTLLETTTTFDEIAATVSGALDSIAADALALQGLAKEKETADTAEADAMAMQALAVDANESGAHHTTSNNSSSNSRLPWPLVETPLASIAEPQDDNAPGSPTTNAAVAAMHSPPIMMPLAPGALARQAEPIPQKFYNSLQKHHTPQVPPQFVMAEALDRRQQRPQPTPQQQQQQHQNDREEPLLLSEGPTTSPASLSGEQQQQQGSSATLTLSALFSKWLGECAWPGMGLFSESYLLFSVGTLKPIWEQLFPNCFNGEECAPRVLHSLTYSVVMGVIVGMILVGCRANKTGRRNGSIFTASLMTVGAMGLCWSSFMLVQHVENMYKCMSVSLFIFGMGVGGEYPLSAASASEKAMQKLRESQAMAELEKIYSYPKPRTQQNDDEGSYALSGPPLQHPPLGPPKEAPFTSDEQRGSSIQLVFMMQGLGIFFNNIVLMALLILTGQATIKDAQTYDPQALLGIWRGTYGIGAFLLVYVLVTRTLYLAESQVWAEDKQRRDLLVRNSKHAEIRAATSGLHLHPSMTGRSLPLFPPLPHIVTSVSSLSTPSVTYNHDERLLLHVPSTESQGDLKSSSTVLLLRNFGVRLGGASLCWLLWDIAFYGNKLFQSSFLLALTGEDTTLFQFAAAAALNSLVALLGYIGAALVVDHPRVGRLRLQQWGFFLTGALFVTCGFLFHRVGSAGLVLLYLASSFFGQLGPNCTTFLIPAEIFPTEMRTMCHGICAASGKVGALIAAVLFNRISDVDMFLVSGYASFAALVVTFWTIPESMGLDLSELDRKWIMILEGRKGEYIGAANDPKHLSFYERRKLGLQY